MSKKLIERLRKFIGGELGNGAADALESLEAAYDSAVEAGKSLAKQAFKAERERDALRLVCAEAYQMAGALGASVEALDNLSAAANGQPLPHETFLPALSEESEIEKERDALAAELKALREQEPVAWYLDIEGWGREYNGLPRMSNGGIGTRLYALPVPARELTDKVICDMWIEADDINDFGFAIERYLKGEGE